MGTFFLVKQSPRVPEVGVEAGGVVLEVEVGAGLVPEPQVPKPD